MIVLLPAFGIPTIRHLSSFFPFGLQERIVSVSFFRCPGLFRIRQIRLVQHDHMLLSSAVIRNFRISAGIGYARIEDLDNDIDKLELFAYLSVGLLHMTRIPLYKLFLHFIPPAGQETDPNSENGQNRKTTLPSI